MIGRSRVFLDALRRISKIAGCDAPVLIEGETGTGKELAARAIHYQSARSDMPFVPVNCGAIPDSLLENELFGHQQGAYTDARHNQPGLIELANGGTLFLDEVDTFSPKGQVTLLRFLQDLQYRPLGSRSIQKGNVRIVAAANVDLTDLAERGRFRMDLLYRLRILDLWLPPLRERKGDPNLLAEHFMVTASKRFAQPVRQFHSETLAWFDVYSWPGNVRELENIVYRESLLADGEEIRIDSPTTVKTRFHEETGEADFNRAKARVIADFERTYLTSLMARAHGNVTRAAVMAGKERRTIGKLLKKHGIDKSRFDR